MLGLCVLIKLEITCNACFFLHPLIKVEFVFINGLLAYQRLILGIKAFKLSVFFCSGTGHLKTSVLCSEKIPAMNIVCITIAVVVDTISRYLFLIDPKCAFQINRGGINP